MAIVTAFSLLVFISSCGNDDSADVDTEVDTSDVTLEAAIINHADIVLASYTDSRDDAQLLLDAVQALVDDPSEATHEAAKEAWINAQESYGQTEVYRFYGGPIDDEDGPEGQLNAWPLDESLIDYVTVAANGEDGANDVGVNIINSPDEYPTITMDVIAGLNELDGGETNVATGYHAVEFLLWGQDDPDVDGAGQRSYLDYVTDGTGTNDNQDRRGDYLIAAAELIVEDLNSLITEWSAGGDYRTFFTSEDELETSLERILNGMGKLSVGELAGERIIVALEAQTQEDEHSCFSDNTHRDVVTNAMGIQNVYLGTYGSISGVGIYDVVAEQDEELANELRAQIIESVRLAGIIQPPFDLEILDGTPTAPGAGWTRVNNVALSLTEQSLFISEIAEEFGYTFDPSNIDDVEVD